MKERSTDRRTPGIGSVGTGSDGPVPTGASAALSAKGETTRAAIIDSALRLVAEHGYERTTMRAIARDAGVSLGNAYYYFASKEHLIQGFYERAGDEHRAAAAAFLDGGPESLEARLVGVIRLWIETMAPYRSFAGALFRSAADPASPLSPFSPESRPAREKNFHLFRTVIGGSDASHSAELHDELPELLWLYFMGIVLFWVHDRSAQNARTHLVNERMSPLIVRAVQLAGLPVARGIAQQVIDFVAELKAIDEPS